MRSRSWLLIKGACSMRRKSIIGIRFCCLQCRHFIENVRLCCVYVFFVIRWLKRVYFRNVYEDMFADNEVEMNLRDAFEILQIESTDDKRMIKRAYAALVRQYHPEEHPAEWAKLHQAYEAALDYAENRSVNSREIRIETVPEWVFQPKEIESERESNQESERGSNQESEQEQQETEAFFRNRLQEQEQKLREAEHIVLDQIQHVGELEFNQNISCESISYESMARVLYSPEMNLVYASDAVLEALFHLLQERCPEPAARRLLRAHLRRIGQEIAVTSDVDSRADKLNMIKMIEKCLSVWDERTAPPRVTQPSPDRQSSDRQSSDRQSSDRQSSDRQSSDRQSSDRQSSDRQSSDRQPPERQSSDRQSSDRQSSDRQSSDRQSSDRQSSYRQSSDRQSSSRQSSNQQSQPQADTTQTQREFPFIRIVLILAVCMAVLFQVSKLMAPIDAEKHAKQMKENAADMTDPAANGALNSNSAADDTGHIRLTNEAKQEGAGLGAPDVAFENIIGLYQSGADEQTVTGELSEHHMVIDVRQYVPDRLKLPRVWEFVGSVYVKSRDEVADEVVLCMPLQEFGLKDGEISIYTYEEESREYILREIDHPESNEGADFPYIYDNVLYMQMQEYPEDYEGIRLVTVILRTPKR